MNKKPSFHTFHRLQRNPHCTHMDFEGKVVYTLDRSLSIGLKIVESNIFVYLINSTNLNSKYFHIKALAWMPFPRLQKAFSSQFLQGSGMQFCPSPINPSLHSHGLWGGGFVQVGQVPSGGLLDFGIDLKYGNYVYFLFIC